MNFTHYAHFTSPIRRYPDLVIHRQIKSLLNKKYKAYGEEDLSDMGGVLSAAEQRAVKAERKVTSIKKSRFFESHIGEEFEGYMSSVVKFGAFVTLRDFPIDGLIKLDELTGDYFNYDEENWCLVGKRTGKVFRVGDKVKIKVVNVSVSDGKIDFSLLEHDGKESVRGSVKKGFFNKFVKRDKPSKNSKKKSSSKKSKSKSSKSKDLDSKDSGSKKSKKKKKANVSKASSLFSASSNSRGLAFGKKKSKKKKR